LFTRCLSEGFPEKAAENRPTIKSKFSGGLSSATFSENPSEIHHVNIEILNNRN